MAWLLTSPVHQQLWYWLWRCSSSWWGNFNNLRHFSVEKLLKMGISTIYHKTALYLSLVQCTKSCTVSEYPCPSQCPRPWQNCVYTTSEAPIRGQPRQWPFLVASHHKKRRLWACTLHNLGQTRTSVSEEIATCSDELGHRRPRQKSQPRTRTSVNAKQQFTCFDYVRARTRMLRPRSRM